MCLRIETLLKDQPPDQCFHTYTIKEKLGELRVHLVIYPDTNEEILQKCRQIIAEAEKLAAKTCQESGLPGKLYWKACWFKVLCPKIAESNGWKLY